MKRKKSVIALACGIAAVLSVIAGCGEKKTVQQGTGEVTTLTYWCPMESNIATRVQSFNDVEMYKQREKDSGIHIEFIHPALGQEGEQFNLLIASRELPDLVEYNWTGYQGGAQKAIDDGVIISLNDYMDKYAPNFKKAVTDKSELSPIYDKGSKTDEGIYFAFPCFNVGNYRTFGGPMIRKDWLDELGLKVPETLDDWTEALTAFKEKKGATAPLTCTKGFIIGGDIFSGGYNIGQGFYLDGDIVKYGVLQSEYKDYLALMKKWYGEGLLDQDFSTNKSNIVDANITMGKSGAVVGYLGGSMGRYLKQMQTEDPNYNLVCAPYPTLTANGENNFYLAEGDISYKYLAITTSCKNPEAAVEWADYLYSDEGYYLVNFGVEGKSYNMVDGKPVYTDVILNNPDGLSINEALGLYCRATAQAPGFKQAPEYLEQYYEFPQQTEGFMMWAENVENVRKHRLPEALSANADESEELAALSTDIRTYVDEMCLKFIMGEESLDNYDNFIETLKNSFNVDRYIEIEQNMYNRYLDR